VRGDVVRQRFGPRAAACSLTRVIAGDLKFG